MNAGEYYLRLLDDLKHGRRCGGCVWWGDRGDSVLEQMFWRMFRSTRKGWHGAADQFQIDRYRVDAIIDCDTKIVVVELDGAAYHDVEKDRIRDDELLNQVDAIIRIPYAPLKFYWDSVMYVLGQWFPRFGGEQLLTTYTAPEFDADFESVKSNGDIDTEHWLEEVDPSFDVVKMDGDRAFIYSPKGYLSNWNMRPITVRYGNGRPDLLMDRIYDEAGCIKVNA